MKLKEINKNNKIVYINFDKTIIVKCKCISKLYSKIKCHNERYDERYAKFYCNIIKVLEIYDFSKNIIQGPVNVGIAIERKKILNLKELIKIHRYLYTCVNKTFLGALICYYTEIDNIKFHFEPNGFISGFSKRNFHFGSTKGIYDLNDSLTDYYVNFFNNSFVSIMYRNKKNTCSFRSTGWDNEVVYTYIIKKKRIIIKKYKDSFIITIFCNKKLKILKIMEEKEKEEKEEEEKKEKEIIYKECHPISKEYQKKCDELILYFNFIKALVEKELKYLPEKIQEAIKIIT